MCEARAGDFAQGTETVGAAQPQYKGIFEPVNYPEDLQFSDVYFVNVDVGYVAGQAGTILKTTNGGAKWDPQLGGDPQSEETDLPWPCAIAGPPQARTANPSLPAGLPISSLGRSSLPV